MIQEDTTKRTESFDRYRERITNFSSEFEIGLFLYLTRQIWLWLVIVMAISIGTGYLYIRYTPPIYESDALIQRTTDNNAQRLLNVQDPLQENDELTADVAVLKSPLLMQKVVKSMPLEVRYYLEGNFLTHEKYNGSVFQLVDFQIINASIINVPVYINLKGDSELNIQYTINEKEYTCKTKPSVPFKCDHFQGSINIEDLSSFHAQQKEGKFYFTFSDEQALAEEFAKRVRVNVANSFAKTISLRFEHANPILAKDVLASLISNFDDFDSVKRTESSNRIVHFINSQKDSVSKKLGESEIMLKQFKDTNDIRQVEGMTDSYLKRIESMEEEALKLDLDIEILNEISRVINDSPQKLDVYNLLPVLIGSKFESGLYDLVSTLHNKLLEYESLLSERTNDHQEIKQTEYQISVQTRLISEGISSLLSRHKTRKASLDSKLRMLDSKFDSLPGKELEYARLQRIFTINDKYFTLLLEKETEYALTRVGVTSNTNVLRDPAIPEFQKSPSKKIALIVVVLAGTLICVLITVIRYLSHNEITSLNEITKISNASLGILGMVPMYKKNIPISQLIIDKNPKSMISEAFRSIRSNMQFISKGEDTKMIAVTSTISGEGKTFVAINLAGIIAFSGKKVVILDLDMRKPKIHLGFGVENGLGMSTLLIGKSTIDECINKSQLDGLDFITAGPIPPNPSELIINGEFDVIIEKLKEKYDLVIVDNPPVGLVTDGLSIIQKADIPIYIFRANYSKKNFIQNVDRLVNENKIFKLSTVLNGVDIKRKSYGYNYGYGYGYGYTYGYGYGNYYEEDEPKKRSFIKRLFRRK